MKRDQRCQDQRDYDLSLPNPGRYLDNAQSIKDRLRSGKDEIDEQNPYPGAKGLDVFGDGLEDFL